MLGKLLGVDKIINGVKSVAEIFFGNRANREQQETDEHTALREAYGKEFSYLAADRNWFDSLLDGINRLPRPTFTFGTLYLFYMSVDDPDKFKTTMEAVSHVPDFLWYLIFVIVTFFFGARSLEKTLIPKFTQAQLKSWKKFIEQKSLPNRTGD